VYGVCLKYLKNRDEAQDAVMQVHEKLIQTLLEHRIANFKSWLYATARNHCLMQLRSQKGRSTQELSPFIMENEVEQHLEEETGLEHSMAALEKCIEKLVGDQQWCIRLFYLNEKCYKEVAEETGFDLNRVKSYIQNGKRNLKICMEENVG
jgi:RNA polymerase sigma-70 factor (ECF subfamily)